MKFMSLLFIFFLCLGAFMAGWVLGSQYERTKDSILIAQKSSALSTESATGAQKNNKLLSVSEPLPEVSDSPSKKREFEEKQLMIKAPVKEKLEDKTSLPDASLFKKGDFKEEELKVKTPVPPDFISQKDTVKADRGVVAQIKQEQTKPSAFLILKEKHQLFNRQQFAEIKDRQGFFNENGRYSFLINVFLNEVPVWDHINNLKKRFPLWSFFITSDKSHYRIYLGPFQTKKQALDFIQNLSAPSPFPNYFLEEKSFVVTP